VRDVVITGIGLRTPLGDTLDEVREAFATGRSAIRAFDGPGGRQRLGGRLRGDITAGFTRSQVMLMDPVAQLTAATSDDTLADSGIDLDAIDRGRVGVFVGTGQSTAQTSMEGSVSLALNDTVGTFTILRGLGNATANHVSIRHGLRGESQTTVLACASSNMALGNAMRMIRHGYLDAAIAGGAEATFSEHAVRAWESMRVLAKPHPAGVEATCRPFSKSRGGVVLGEGCVLYLLEAEAHARARGARIYARVVGFGSSCDATHIAHPDAAGQARAMQACLRDAGASPADLGYINLHGTGTPTGDPVEVAAVHQALGEHATRVPVSSTKSMHGHLLGAAGAVELLAPILALRDGLIAPTAHLTDPDPAFDLDFVPCTARTGVRMDLAMSSNFAFGGSNVCLLLAR
jgi:3-oxoacyl-[acyl-carrier-protein] synthase II